MQYTGPYQIKENLPFSPQPNHGKDDHCMCMTNLPVHLIFQKKKKFDHFTPPRIRENICLHVIIRFIPFKLIYATQPFSDNCYDLLTPHQGLRV